MPRHLNKTFLYFSSGRKNCISKYLGIYTYGKNTPYIKSSKTVVHRAFHILHGSLWFLWLCSPLWSCGCFFISQQTQQKPQLSQPVLAASHCSQGHRCCGMGGQTQTLLPHPKTKRDKRAGCWFPKSPQTTAQWGAGILCDPSHGFAALPSCHSGFSCHFGVLGTFRPSVGTATTTINRMF